jgi:hypothetical protein
MGATATAVTIMTPFLRERHRYSVLHLRYAGQPRGCFPGNFPRNIRLRRLLSAQMVANIIEGRQRYPQFGHILILPHHRHTTATAARPEGDCTPGYNPPPDSRQGLKTLTTLHPAETRPAKMELHDLAAGVKLF